MTKQILLAASCTIALAVSSIGAMAAGDAAAGKAKSATCVACHQADGNSTNPEWPKIAGQGAKYLVKQLKDYKSGARVNAVMQGMVAALSEQDMEDLAAYFASQNTTGGFVSEENYELGKRIYQGGNLATGVPACSACHGPAGKGNPAGAMPALSGQHALYTANQLKAFRAKMRANDANGMMRGSARWLSDEEIEAVSEYIGGLH